METHEIEAVQKMLNERLQLSGYEDLLDFHRHSGIGDHIDRETLRRCFNDPLKMPGVIKVALVMKFLGYSPILIKQTMVRLGDTVYHSLLCSDPGYVLSTEQPTPQDTPAAPQPLCCTETALEAAAPGNPSSDSPEERVSMPEHMLVFTHDGEFFRFQDGSMGVAWECRPFDMNSTDKPWIGRDFLDRLAANTVLQFIVTCGQQLSLASYWDGSEIAVSDDVRSRARQHCAYIQEAVGSVSGVAPRQFNLYVTMKLPGGVSEASFMEQALEMTNFLTVLGLEPKVLHGDGYFFLLQGLMKTHQPKTGLLSGPDCFVVQEFDKIHFPSALGGLMGVSNDKDQLNFPYVFALNLYVPEGCGTAKNSKLIQPRALPLFWLGASAEKDDFASARLRRLVESTGCILQAGTGRDNLYAAALPFGLRTGGSDIEHGDLSQEVKRGCSLPLLADLCSMQPGSAPIIPMVGRRGQLTMLDPFAGRHGGNMLIAGSGGTGARPFVNWVLHSGMAVGRKGCVIDPMGLHTRPAKRMGGRVVAFSHVEPISLNPFARIIDPNRELPFVAALVQLICEPFCDLTLERNLVFLRFLARNAVEAAWRKDATAAGLSEVVYELIIQQASLSPQLRTVCQDMVCALGDFAVTDAGTGCYAAWFNGPHADLTSANLTVFDFSGVRMSRHLFPPMLAQVLIGTLFNKPGHNHDERFCHLADAWLLPKKSPAFLDIMSMCLDSWKGFRAPMSIEVQQLADIERLDDLGRLICGHIDTIAMFEPGLNDTVAALTRCFGPAANPDNADLYKTVHSFWGRYLEILLRTSDGKEQIARLCLDKASWELCNGERLAGDED